ncbi:cobalamin (vitamin B12) biosynthesis CbiG protein [Alkaliphilus metalliredigens QYMF]|uniref:Cobalamin (Vitamin B12) biosynthesis CbiG protein n=1 Tax=Alkaliphilus metalliredigens (strain QYMF) TaxID=293826 RepID=A6TJF0_ALKMQ|nr:cobalt-precorrin 5A hydrolase [Alkaliphilus metalliredigens]ABR46318.1 cobalamin (vitamin B12) biosynthesis CbiG protein [Alkaliphilus metalliredigens QYMF]
MKIAIIALTKGGKTLALVLQEFLEESHLYLKGPLPLGEKNVFAVGEDFKRCVAQLFSAYDILVFIMATGIVVRSIAPLLQHKSQDPGVLVMDEKGQNVISLLSGHWGRANEMTQRVATMINANPVITTASDVQGRVAVDLLAQQLNCEIADWQLTKTLTAHIVNDGIIGLYCEDNRALVLPEGYVRVSKQKDLEDHDYGIIISNQSRLGKRARDLQLYPRNLVIGIGCRKKVSPQLMIEKIKASLKNLDKSTHSIEKFVTVEVKKEEKAIIEASAHFNVPLEIIDIETIKKSQTSLHQFETSAFVEKTIGVGAVSGPCAYIGSQGGHMLMEKEKGDGITLSIAEVKVSEASERK